MPTRPVIAWGTSIVMSDQAWRPTATRALPGLAEDQDPPRRNARVICPTTASISPTTASRSTSAAIPAHPHSAARVHADLDPVLAGVDHEIDLLVAEVAGKTGCDMADEDVGPLGGTDGDVAIGVVDFEHDRLVEVNGDAFLAPSVSVSSVRHDSSSERCWVPG